MDLSLRPLERHVAVVRALFVVQVEPMSGQEARSAAMTEREARLIAGTYTGSDVEALREELSAAEARARASQEFIAHTLDYYGGRLPSQWKAHAKAVLADE